MGPRKSGIVDSQEMKRRGTLPPGKQHWVRVAFLNLEVGITYYVDRNDWNWEGKTPNDIVKDLHKKTNLRFEFLRTADHLGWFITRLE